MKKSSTILFLLVSTIAHATSQSGVNLFFSYLNKYEFEKARVIAVQGKSTQLGAEMISLVDLLYYEGQKDSAFFKSNATSPDTHDDVALFVLYLKSGYLDFYYDKQKGNSYKTFYKAYQLAVKLENPTLIKASLLAILKYFNSEIAQNSTEYLPFLDHLESIKGDLYDEMWVILYKVIFQSKTLGKMDTYYFELTKKLDFYETKIAQDSPLLVYLFYEKALKFEIEKRNDLAEEYYVKTVIQAGDHPYLKSKKFFSLLKLMMISIARNDFAKARTYLDAAKMYKNLADTLRSSYYLNLYGSFYYNAKSQNDTAYVLLKEAYAQDFQLDFRKNTLEINKLSVELKTQEKENANLRLRQGRLWLITALSGTVLLLLITYLSYSNQRSKTRIEKKEREVQAMKLETLLKEHEIFGIDSMIAGQEKERQRIANDLHDNLGSLLVTLKLHFQNIVNRYKLADTEPEKLLEKTNDLMEDAYQKVRGIAHIHNTGVNAAEGLMPALKTFAAKVSIQNRLSIAVEEHGMDKRLENSVEITIFRIIQELVTNVIKHANATEVVVNLTHFDQTINIMVEDNGVGFKLSDIMPKESMGLYSIQKRIENIGGQVTIDSILHKGTTVIIDIPIA